MSSIFTRIINGDIPCYKVYEDDNHIAFLDIRPIKLGHLLVVPKKEIDDIFQLDVLQYEDLWRFVRKVAKGMKKSIDCNRIGISVVGLEVPHVHVHLIPINKMDDMSFNSKIKLSNDEFVNIMEKIKLYL